MAGADRIRRHFYFGGAMLGIVTLALTKSRTSLAAFVIAAVVYGTLVWTGRRRGLGANCPSHLRFHRHRVCGSPGLGGAKMAQTAVSLGQGSQETDTLSGRIPLWESGISYFYARP